jgi:hypothetical protein
VLSSDARPEISSPVEKNRHLPIPTMERKMRTYACLRSGAVEKKAGCPTHIVHSLGPSQPAHEVRQALVVAQRSHSMFVLRAKFRATHRLREAGCVLSPRGARRGKGTRNGVAGYGCRHIKFSGREISGYPDNALHITGTRGIARNRALIAPSLRRSGDQGEAPKRPWDDTIETG